MTIDYNKMVSAIQKRTGCPDRGRIHDSLMDAYIAMRAGDPHEVRTDGECVNYLLKVGAYFVYRTPKECRIPVTETGDEVEFPAPPEVPGVGALMHGGDNAYNVAVTGLIHMKANKTGATVETIRKILIAKSYKDSNVQGTARRIFNQLKSEYHK